LYILIKKLIFLFILLAALIAFWTSTKPGTDKTANLSSIDLDAIRKRGKLIAVTDFNSTDYFIYKGEPMGFNYELLKSFSDFIGIDLEIIAENSIDRAFTMVQSGEADLLAFGLTAGSPESSQILFTDPVDVTRQVLVQRKPRNWYNLPNDSVEKKLIRNDSELAKKSVYVQEKSSHGERLAVLEKEIGDKVNIIPVPYESEKLIQHVASGEIDFTVCDENVALVNATYYSDIDVSTPVSLPQNLAWGVRKENSGNLLKELNRWISVYKNTTSYALLHAKYYRNSRSSLIVKSDYYALSTGRVSKYDDLIREFSPNINWDWRLLASLICQESQFRPDVTSVAGAYGLMQIMPVTGKNFGIDITASPKNNIRAGILYIRRLNELFASKVPDEQERLYFILASYNAGPGHVLDAMRLAGKNGMDPQKWEGNVAVWLLKKSEPQYFRDSVVRNGYFRGRESVKFVSEVLDRFGHYKNIIPQDKSRPF
jgi:membrane-bound lytic murein transglycosylase F